MRLSSSFASCPLCLAGAMAMCAESCCPVLQLAWLDCLAGFSTALLSCCVYSCIDTQHCNAESPLDCMSFYSMTWCVICKRPLAAHSHASGIVLACKPSCLKSQNLRPAGLKFCDFIMGSCNSVIQLSLIRKVTARHQLLCCSTRFVHHSISLSSLALLS